MNGRRPLPYPVDVEEFQPYQQVDNYCVAAACVGDVMQDVEAAQAFYDLKTYSNLKSEFPRILRAAHNKDSVKAMYCALQFAGRSVGDGISLDAADDAMRDWVKKCKLTRSKSPGPLGPDQYPRCPIGDQALMVHMIDYYDTFRWHNDVYLALDIHICFEAGVKDTTFAIHDAYASMVTKSKQGYLYYKLYVEQFMEIKDGILVRRPERKPKLPLFPNAPTHALGHCVNSRFTTSPVLIEAADLVDLDALSLLYSTSRSLKDLEMHVLDLLRDPDLYWDKSHSYKALLSALKFDSYRGPDKEMLIVWILDRMDIRNGVFSRSTQPSEFPFQNEDPSIFSSVVDLHGSTRWQFLLLLAARVNKAFAALEKGHRAPTIGDMMRSIRDTTEEGDALYRFYEEDYMERMDSSAPETQVLPQKLPHELQTKSQFALSSRPTGAAPKRYLFQLQQADKERLQDHPHGKKLIKSRVEIEPSDVADLRAARVLWETGSMKACELKFWSIMDSYKPEPQKHPYKMIYAALKFRQLAVMGDHSLDVWMAECLDLRDRDPRKFQKYAPRCPLGSDDVYRCIIDYFATTRFQINYMVASTMLHRFEQQGCTSGPQFDSFIESMRLTLYEGPEIADMYRGFPAVTAPAPAAPKLLPLPNVNSKFSVKEQFILFSEAMRKFRFSELDDIHALQQFSESVSLENFKNDFLRVFKAAEDKEAFKTAYAAVEYAAQDQDGKKALDRWAAVCTQIRETAPEPLKPSDYPQSPIGNNSLMLKMMEIHGQARWKVNVLIATYAVINRPAHAQGDLVLAAFEKMATEFKNGHWAYSLYIERFYNVVDGSLVKKPVRDTDMVNPYTKVTTPRHMTLFHPIADPKLREDKFCAKLQRGRVKIAEADLKDLAAALAIMDFGSSKALQKYVKMLESGLYGSDLPYFEIKDSIYAMLCAVAYSLAEPVVKQRTQDWILECLKRREESITGDVEYEPCPLAEHRDGREFKCLLDLFGTTRLRLDILMADTINNTFLLKYMEKQGVKHSVSQELNYLYHMALISQDYDEGDDFLQTFHVTSGRLIAQNEPHGLQIPVMSFADVTEANDGVQPVFDYALGLVKVRDRDLNDVDAAYELYELKTISDLQRRLEEIERGDGTGSLRNMYGALTYVAASQSAKGEFLAWCDAARERMCAYVDNAEHIDPDPNDPHKPFIPLGVEDYPDPPIGNKKTMLALVLVEGTTRWNVDVWFAETIYHALEDRRQGRRPLSLFDAMVQLSRQVPEGLRLYHMFAERFQDRFRPGVV